MRYSQVTLTLEATYNIAVALAKPGVCSFLKKIILTPVKSAYYGAPVPKSS